MDQVRCLPPPKSSTVKPTKPTKSQAGAKRSTSTDPAQKQKQKQKDLSSAPPATDKRTARTDGTTLEILETSTPHGSDHCKNIASKPATRSESALLRIQTTIRAAAEAESRDRTGAASEPEEMERDGSELCSTLDDHSMCSVGVEGGGFLSELPRRANAVLQTAKASLESSGNLRKDIKESLTGSLQTLYEMVLRLADSRHRHMLENQRAIVAHEKRLTGMERSHAKNLRAVEDRAREEGAAHRKLLETIANDVAAQRTTFVTDIQECLERMRAARATPRGVAGQHRERSLDGLIPIQKTLEEIQSVLTNKHSAGEAIEREELITEIRRLRSDLRETSSGTSALKEDTKKAATVHEQVTELEEKIGIYMEQMHQRFGKIDIGLQGLIDQNNITPIETRIGKVEDSLRCSTEALRKTTIEGFDSLRDEITVVAAMRQGISLHDELTMPTQQHLIQQDGDPCKEWRVVRSGRRGRGREPPTSVSTDHLNPEPRHKKSPETSTRHTVLVESVDPRHTSDDVIKKVKAEVDVVKLGIGVNSLRKVRGQKILVGCDTAEDQRALREAVMGLGIGLSAATQSLKNPLLKFAGVTNDLTDAKIIEAITNQNKSLLGELARTELDLKIVRRATGRIPEVSNVIAQVSPALWSCLRDQKVRIGFQIIPTYDQTPVIQCYRCLEFGHVARFCKNEVVCGYCAGSHDTRNCAKREEYPVCKTCNNHQRDSCHPAYSSLCPEWQKWDKLARSSTNYPIDQC